MLIIKILNLSLVRTTLNNKKNPRWQFERLSEEKKKPYVVIPLITLFSCFLNKQEIHISVLHWTPQIT